MFEELINYYPFWTYAFVALYSLAMGSLLNVIIYRLPILLHQEWQEHCCEVLAIEKKQSQTRINLFFPRSFCPHCKSMIKAWQNIPLFSYLFLKGRCYQCHEKISLRYPLIELLTMILSILAYWHFGFELKLVFALFAIYLLICLFFIDLDHQILPDSLSLGLLWLGLLANTQNMFTSINDAVFAAAGGYLTLWFFIKMYYLITAKIGMGNGDFKLFAALGACFGGLLLPFILILSALSGAILGYVYLSFKKYPKDTRLPFGPFLCIGGLVSLFCGSDFLNWYLQVYR